MLKYYRKTEFVENVWPANSVLFIYVQTHCVETVKSLDNNQYLQLSRWLRGNATDQGARVPGFDFWFSQEFLYLNFCFVVVVVVSLFLFLSKLHFLHDITCMFFAMLIYLVHLTYCKKFDRFQRYKDNDLASLRGFRTTEQPQTGISLDSLIK